MNVEELYERHQVLSALGGVLLHDLRNPLHSATLLVEAMGLRANDLDVLRTRLRAQLAKLDALISEAGAPMRELAVDPRIDSVQTSELLADVLELVKQRSGEVELGVEVQPSEPVLVLVDRKMIARAVFEVVAHLDEEIRGKTQASLEAAAPRVVIRVTEDASTAMLAVDGFEGSFADAVAKSPFSIAGGGVGLALARALTQLSAAASLRLQDGAGPRPRFVFSLPKAESDRE